MLNTEVAMLVWIIATAAISLLVIRTIKLKLASEMETSRAWKEQALFATKKSESSKVRSYTRKEFAERQTTIQKTQNDIARNLQSYLASEGFYDHHEKAN